MAAIFERELVVLVVMRHIGFVVHGQKFGEGHLVHLAFVFGIMLNEQRQPQHFTELGEGGKVSEQEKDGNGACHCYCLREGKESLGLEGG